MKKKIYFLIIPVLILGGFFISDKISEKNINLKGFYQLTQADPLFYSPFLDSEKVKNSIQKFKIREQQVKDATYMRMERGDLPKEPVLILNRASFAPYEFLDQLIVINSKTEEFIRDPSAQLAEELLNLYDAAANAYIKGIQSDLKTIERLNRLAKRPLIIFYVDTITSSEIIKNDLLIIKENGLVLKEEIKKRRDCLYGKIDCSSLIKQKDNAQFFKSLEESKNFNLKGGRIDFVKNTLLSAFQDYDVDIEVRGPYPIYISCWPRTGKEVWIYLFQISKKNGKTFTMLKLATQNYYRKVKKEPKFAFQESAYQCPNQTFLPYLLALDFIQEKIDKGIITKQDLINSEYKLFIENQFGLLDQILDLLSIQFTAPLLVQIQSNIPRSPQDLFLARLPYSIFYFPFAKSIWRIDKELQYLLPPEQQKLIKRVEIATCITLDDLLELGYSKNEIEKFHVYPWETELFDF